MEQKQKQLLATAALVCAVVCSEKPAKKKKRRHRRMCTRPWLREWGQQGRASPESLPCLLSTLFSASCLVPEGANLLVGDSVHVTEPHHLHEP